MAQYYANDLRDAADSIEKVGDVVRAFYVITGLLAGGIPGFGMMMSGAGRLVFLLCLGAGLGIGYFTGWMHYAVFNLLAQQGRCLSAIEENTRPTTEPKNHGQPWR